MIKTLTLGLIFSASFIPDHRDLFNFVGVTIKGNGLSRGKGLAPALCLCVISLPATLAVQQNLVYDANGNLITGDGRYREYNAFNQLVKVRSGNTSTGALLEEFIYHPVEERVLVKRVYNTSTDLVKVVLYVNDNFVREFGMINGAPLRGINDTYYVRDDSGIVGEARFNRTGITNRSRISKVRTWFYQNDLKGSVAVITNASGSVMEQTFYDPFGNILQGGSKPKFSYEAKEFDSRAAAYDFHFRQYKPDYGKFTQPDTLIQNVYDPQQLNRYTFERNNPYKNKDLNGHGPPEYWGPEPSESLEVGGVTVALEILEFVGKAILSKQEVKKLNTQENTAQETGSAEDVLKAIDRVSSNANPASLVITSPKNSQPYDPKKVKLNPERLELEGTVVPKSIKQAQTSAFNILFRETQRASGGSGSSSRSIIQTGTQTSSQSNRGTRVTSSGKTVCDSCDDSGYAPGQNPRR